MLSLLNLSLISATLKETPNDGTLQQLHINANGIQRGNHLHPAGFGTVPADHAVHFAPAAVPRGHGQLYPQRRRVRAAAANDDPFGRVHAGCLHGQPQHLRQPAQSGRPDVRSAGGQD
uniref:(northern house mosquito) hypothetical protein n=1 Tax=Culex pipiens TaxID=7175 RepID=A0A8D8HIN6_CULPI